MNAIHVPDQVRSGDYAVIVSMSGGKDSTATALALREAGVDVARYVFADTGWEAPETYAHLDELRRLIGSIDVCGVEGGMRARARYRGGFPSRMQRWCTRELKIEPLRKYHDAFSAEDGRDTVSTVGVRAAESQARSGLGSWEDDDRWGGYVWRPLIAWTVADVLAIHHRHGVPVNPLYFRGHNRVGCYPCIFSQKEEIRLIAKEAPERIDEIRAFEQEIDELRAARNVEKPGRYKPSDATFFMSIDRTTTNYIDKVVEWARTDRGGRQLPLVQPPPSGGCFRWGLCEPASVGEE